MYNGLTKKEIEVDINEMLSILKWSNPTIECAGSESKFKSTKTSNKFYYENYKGERCFRGAINGSIYYFLKWQFRKENCACDYGVVLKSNYGSNVKCTCPDCGGYYMKNPKL